MRTTTTLDTDVEKLIRDCMKQRGVSFKQALNDAVRAGLGRGHSLPTRRFVQKTYSLGPVRNFNWDKALFVAEAIEDEDFSRKLSGRQ
jgi:hypothetical protein